MKNILKFLVKRIIASFITLLLIITITFVLLHKLPGDPFQGEKAIPPQIKANLMAKYNLDKPLSTQYKTYLEQLSKADLGLSMKERGRSVNSVIKESFPVSADLGIRAILFGLIVGIPLGILSALFRNKLIDRFSMIIAVIGISVPSFIIAGLLQLYAVNIHKEILINKLHLPLGRILLTGWDSPAKKILPVIALGLFIVAEIARLTRSKMIEIMEQDYIKLAIAKGVSPFKIVMTHALRNALLPIITIISPTIAGVLTGSFVIETMFGIPGLGKYYIGSIIDRDYTMVLGVTVFYAAFLILMMIIMDLVYALVDPKIKIGGGK
ncbi:ABC transporter permease [Sneathia vaginalis]|jgi:ABC transporter, permease protein|uniref:Peptide ABC transporter permease n=1 Tax=Sneathia vaginalis TaxID=187101 RepID=A0A0E3ZBR8_9FUSO|nr:MULTISPECIES: ABC transporter permease [Sneathia]AKC95951.1 peptide ABC transporter permease [Sneathia vaginalis]MBE3030717.1 ABC transporter permease [Sneathia sp. DSM 16631]MDK9581429.1 ABC transporter permease [Sneathia vaginalis]